MTIGRSITWNGNIWIGIGQNTAGNSTSTVYAYSLDGITWTASSGITNGLTIGNSVVWNTKLGSVNINSVNSNATILLDKYGASGTYKLDIVADSYFNTGFTNMTVTTKTAF